MKAAVTKKQIEDTGINQVKRINKIIQFVWLSRSVI